MRPHAGSLEEARLFARHGAAAPCDHDALRVQAELHEVGTPATYRVVTRCGACALVDELEVAVLDLEGGAGDLASASEWLAASEREARAGAIDRAIATARLALERETDEESRSSIGASIEALSLRRGPPARARRLSQIRAHLAERGEELAPSELTVVRAAGRHRDPMRLRISIDAGSRCAWVRVQPKIPLGGMESSLSDAIRIANGASRGGAFRHRAGVEHTTHVFLDAGGCVSLGALDRAIDESQLAIDRYWSLFSAASYPDRRVDRTSVARGALCVDVAKEPILNVTRVFARSGLPCAERRFESKIWWCGRGVRPGDHPHFADARAHAATTRLGEALLGAACAACRSGDVLVLSASSASSMGGDAHYDVELRCGACGAHTQLSYSEND